MLFALVISSCSDTEDYAINTAEIITTVTTGDANVGATSALVNGVVRDLSKSSPASYKVGVIYSTTQDGVQSGTKVAGSISDDGNVTTSISNLQTNVTYYYSTFVTLQDKITKYGEVKSFITTDADIATADPVYSEVSATLSGTLTVATSKDDNVVKGVRVSTDEAGVKTGRLFASSDEGNSFSIPVAGLVPGKTYYYVAYAKINNEEKFGQVKSFTTPEQEVEFVDLGLSVEWATVNVGALVPEDMGGLYGFGDNTLFNASTLASDYVQEDIQGTDNDIASMYIPGAFTPSREQFQELFENTEQHIAVTNGVSGVVFKASNGNQIFLPFTGTRIGSEVSAPEFGAYWTSNIDANDPLHGAAANLSQGGVAIKGANLYEGLAIRPVRQPNRPLIVQYLQQEWSIDLNELGKSAIFDGPLYFYGTDDDWNTVTNGYELKDKDSWSWCPVWKENDWICSAADRGTMEFLADGTVIVNDKGNGKQYKGTYTVDVENRVISLTNAQILHLETHDALVSNWSVNLKILSLTEHGLQIAALRDQSDEGPCLLAHNYASSSLVGGNGVVVEFDNSKLVTGDIEGNGNYRLELYNEWGATQPNPGFDKEKLSFSRNMAVTFKISGIDGNLKEGAASGHVAGLGYADPSWAVQYWGGTPKYDALVNCDGTYTVWMENPVDEDGKQIQANGAMVFVIDIKQLSADLVDPSLVKVEIENIVTDCNTDKIINYVPVNSDKLLFNNKDGNGVDGRIEIYNEYGGTKADPGIAQDDVHFQGQMTVTFTIKGIDGNLVEGAGGNYKADLSYAAASWDPGYWGGGIGTADVTKDGTYTVCANLGDKVADGAVVWCVELYNLWKDLVDPTKVSVTIDEVTTGAVK